MERMTVEKATAAKIRCYNALNSLLEKKKFEKVSVSEVIALADISRSQFYRLFMDKFDLLDHTITYQVDSIYTDDCDLTLYKNRMVALLEMIKRNEIVLALHEHYDSARLFALYYDVFLRLHLRRMNRVQGGVISKAVLRAIRFCSAGSAQMIIDWLMNGCDLSTSELEQALASFLPPILRQAGHAEQAISTNEHKNTTGT